MRHSGRIVGRARRDPNHKAPPCPSQENPVFVEDESHIDTDESNPAARLLLHIFAAFAEFERELIRERVVTGIRAAQGRGIRLGRPQRVFRRDQAFRLRSDQQPGNRPEGQSFSDEQAAVLRFQGNSQ
jgi:hypothetical protein